MCVVWTGRWRETTRSIIAYKLVSTGRFSPVQRQDRTSQMIDEHSFVYYRNGADILHYPKGSTLAAEAPGIYLYRHRSEAACIASAGVGIGFNGRVVISVRIPKGTQIRLGKQRFSDVNMLTINALKIEVLK